MIVSTSREKSDFSEVSKRFYQARDQFMNQLREETGIEAEMKDENIYFDERLNDVLSRRPQDFDVLLNLGCNRVDHLAIFHDEGTLQTRLRGLFLLASCLKPTTKLYVMENGHFIDDMDWTRFPHPYDRNGVPLSKYISAFNDCFRVDLTASPPFFYLQHTPDLFRDLFWKSKRQDLSL